MSAETLHHAPKTASESRPWINLDTTASSYRVVWQVRPDGTHVLMTGFHVSEVAHQIHVAVKAVLSQALFRGHG